MTYKIFYIDDDKSAVNQLIRSFGNDFEILDGFSPNIIFETLIPVLDERNFDFLLVDSNLNEKSGCGFNGERVIKYFTKKFPHFPLMLFTNYDDQVVTEIENFDINKIYSKRELTEKKAKDVFIKKIKRIVDEYKETTEHAEKRLIELLEKKKAGSTLNAEEEQELIELDTFLDEVLEGETVQIPDQIKASNEDKIDSLLKKTDDLIEKLDKYEKVQK